MNILEVNSLGKIYSTKGEVSYKALESIDLNVGAGEFVGIMGPSGSGKTTLLNLLSTIDKPTSGTIQVRGINPAGLSERKLALFRRRELGFVFQDFNLLDTLSLKENIALPLVLDGASPSKIETALEPVAALLGIAPILAKRPYEVSGGQKQRAAIARAIIHQPSLLLADELTGNLDSKSAKDVMESLKDLNERLGATVLMVTHDPFSASYCQRIIFIKDGRFFSEIRRGDNRQAFFQQILDSLSVLGGNFDDVPFARA
ncbi:MULTISPECIES: ABC transporter ATP-binding protein [unclassified Paenibacillus]|uniref:ABC transporter ATP-binding protein n=1 Tax=unclassified Paenibacillus TaxID=185978 RepID=UPI0009572892|nr:MULTISPECIES: ABC transporter ATP-binding protein [unclassified Paenibacillus]ASS66673.1 ABC transporter ATP-binding protein [Paenibacillus sp. RUD330]SIP99025.1 putative ABC transport system ATP-binding protein/putative ABC transport system ATP-binding protein [Paenibacillus sp. RU4X]SIQ17966.1 putative ABC transport system ATP-binding protein/putative ABC transport system ATP-binding protein [Paenibacillus sp. RU4T]